MSHTPGPWSWSGSYLYGGEDALDCVMSLGIDNGICFVEFEREADRSLITAAPDLLAALDELLSAYDRGVTSPKLLDYWQACRAAIRKAKGGS